jgi:hypothetical protein
MKLNVICIKDLKAGNEANWTASTCTGCPVHGRMTFLYLLLDANYKQYFSED